MTRPAVAADLPSVASIYNEGIRGRHATFETTERAPTDLNAWLADTASPFLIAERNGQVVGWARAGEYRARAAYTGVRDLSIYVSATARNTGVGTALLGSITDACEQLGYYKLVGRVFPENTASRALFRRHGFRDVGVYERHGQLDGVWRDVVIVEHLIGRGKR